MIHLKYCEETKNIRNDFSKLLEKYQVVDWTVVLELFVMSLDYILEKEIEVTEMELNGYTKKKKLLKQLLWITKDDNGLPIKDKIKQANVDEIFQQLSRRIRTFWI